jgi:hypothetical protein
MTKLALLVIATSLVACGSKKKGGGDDKPIDVAAVNALVPASLKDKVVFEQRDIIEKRGKHGTKYTVAAPKGWKQDMESFANLKPDKDGMGFMTKFEVGTNCDGECTAKDWAATVEKVYASYLKGATKDVKGTNSRTIVGTSGDMTLVVRAWWSEGDKEYFHCGATLEKEVAELAAAVEKACESITVSED